MNAAPALRSSKRQLWILDFGFQKWNWIQLRINLKILFLNFINLCGTQNRIYPIRNKKKIVPCVFFKSWEFASSLTTFLLQQTILRHYRLIYSPPPLPDSADMLNYALMENVHFWQSYFIFSQFNRFKKILNFPISAL